MILNWAGWEEGGRFGCHRQICRVQHWVQGVQYVVVSAEGKQCNIAGYYSMTSKRLMSYKTKAKERQKWQSKLTRGEEEGDEEEERGRGGEGKGEGKGDEGKKGKEINCLIPRSLKVRRSTGELRRSAVLYKNIETLSSN